MSKEDVTNPAYWRARLAECGGDLHRSMFRGSHDEMAAIEAQQRRQLAREIGSMDSILDAGCGYGRLITLLPAEWCGGYVGVDISPEFIAIAKILHPTRKFQVESLTKLPWDRKVFDVAICCGVREMVIANAGVAVWYEMESELLTVADRLVVVAGSKFD